MARFNRFGALLLLATLLAGCSGTYYKAMEKFGYEKRDILVSRVKDARDDQNEAKEQFKTTLEQFQALTHFNGGDLEKTYKRLNAEYERSESKAKAVSDRIASIEKVANAMFTEWRQELEQYTDPNLKTQSSQKLRDTQARYQTLIAAMKSAESRMKPVLAAFKNRVLFLKHSLNAEAIASLNTTQGEIDTDVSSLIKEMENAIAQANEFIGQMK